jgi:hypothetical protein
MLGSLDWSQKFIFNPDMSENAIACVLLQNDNLGRAYPIYYGRRLMTAWKLKYLELKKLALVVLFGCVRFKHYIVPNKFPIEV